MALVILKDNRKPLSDRLPTAWQLYQDKSIVFPARRQYLLDWLLDAVFRLLKSSSDRISDTLQMSEMWLLLHSLLKEEESIAGLESVLGKRRRIIFRKPILPIITAFILHSKQEDSSSVLSLVMVTLELLNECHEEIITKSTTKPIQELLEACHLHPTSPLIPVVGKTLLIWGEAQSVGGRKKIFYELSSALMPFVNCISDNTLGESVLSQIVFCKENVLELVKEVEPGTQAMQSLLPVILKGIVVDKRYLLSASFVKQAKEYLTPAEARLSMVHFFQELIRNESSPLVIADLLSVFVKESFASKQSDPAWKLFLTLITNESGLIKIFAGEPLVIKQILSIDIALIKEHLSLILGNFKSEDSEWKCLVYSICAGYAAARQLDDFVSVTISKDLPRSLLHSLDPHFEKLHDIVMVKIIDLLNASASATALRWLWVLATIKPKLIADRVKNVSLVEGADYESLLELLVERLNKNELDLEWIKNQVTLQRVGLSLVLFVKGWVDELPLGYEQCPSLHRYLPALLQRLSVNRLVLLKGLPEWMVKCTRLWDSLPDSNEIFLANLDSASYLLFLLRNMPDGLILSYETMNKVIRSILISKMELDSSFTRIFEQGVLTLDAYVINELLATGNSVVIDVLFQRKMISLKQVVINFTLSHVKTLTRHTWTLDDWNSFYHILKGHLESFVKVDPSQQEVIQLAALLASAKSEDMHQWVNDKVPVDIQLQYFMAFFEYGLPLPLDIHWLDIIQTDAISPVTLRRFTKSLDTEEVDEDLSKFIALFPSLQNDKAIHIWDSLLLHSLAMQNLICPHLDVIIKKGGFPFTLPILKLLQHRALCGSVNIAALHQDENLMDAIVMPLPVTDKTIFDEVCALMTMLVKNHWSPLLPRRPIIISHLCKMMKLLPELPASETRRYARLVSDYASVNRQNDQHYYVTPLILTYVNIPMEGTMRKTLMPSMCLLVRHLDQAVSRSEAMVEEKTDKYFNSNPFDRLMKLTESDDAKVLLKTLITTYNEEYKFTGKV